jgi:hypothetical protein
MWKKLALAAGALVALLAVVVSLQPSTFSIERSRVIAAPPEVIAAHIESLRAMDASSP